MAPPCSRRATHGHHLVLFVCVCLLTTVGATLVRQGQGAQKRSSLPQQPREQKGEQRGRSRRNERQEGQARDGTGSVTFAYLWHMQQPIYWPAYSVPGSTAPNPTYQRAWQSIQLQQQQGGHPDSDLRGIFGSDDRVADYQYRVKVEEGGSTHPEGAFR